MLEEVLKEIKDLRKEQLLAPDVATAEECQNKIEEKLAWIDKIHEEVILCSGMKPKAPPVEDTNIFFSGQPSGTSAAGKGGSKFEMTSDILAAYFEKLYNGSCANERPVFQNQIPEGRPNPMKPINPKKLAKFERIMQELIALKRALATANPTDEAVLERMIQTRERKAKQLWNLVQQPTHRLTLVRTSHAAAQPLPASS